MFYKRISMEITRKCNMNCIHCCKGKAQNKSITKDIIDKALENLEDDFVYTFDLFGGEPMLELELIEYVCEQIIKKGLNIFHIHITTNGTIFDNRLINIICRMDEYCYSKQKELNYSDGFTCLIQFSLLEHKNNKMTKEICKKYLEIIKSDRISIKTYDINTYSYNIIYQGNAKYNFDKLKEKYCFRLKEPKSAIRYPHIQLCPKTIQIDVNGNVFPSSCFSYDIQDDKFSDYYMGNIKCEKLNNMIENYNFKYPLDHDLGEMHEFLKTLLFNKENNIEYKTGEYDNYEILNINEQEIHRLFEFYEMIADVRKDLHSKYPLLTYDEIVDMSVFYIDYKTDGKFKEIASGLCKHTPVYFENTGYIYPGKNKVNDLFTMLEINNQNRKYFGNGWDLL